MKETVIKIADVETKQQRIFGYKKDCVNLNFTLRIDVDEELKCFLEILELATKDVKDQLEIINKQKTA